MIRLSVALLLMLLAASAASAQSTVTAQIHNACGWQPSTTYTYSAGPPSGHFLRVNNGAGWTPSDPGVACGTGTWNAGSALNNYQLIAPTTGTCQSASSGGPSGTGSSITDNTCTWKYVSSVDYISISSWALDNGKIWTTGTKYGYFDVVHTTDPNLPVFQQITPGCLSSVKPTTSNINTTLADGCYWVGSLTLAPDPAQQYIYYSSNANTWPMTEMNWDSLQGSISSQSYSASGTIASNVLTVASPPSAGFISAGATVTGTGIASGQYIVSQASGTTGGAGTYNLGVSQSNVTSPTSISGVYAELTITTPPATFAVASGQFVNYAGTASPQNNWSCNQGSPFCLGVSTQIDSTHWTLALQFYGAYTPPSSINSFTGTILLADELNGVVGTNTQFNVGEIWNDQEYVSGQNHEASPIGTWNHNYQYNDSLHGIVATTPTPTTDYGVFGYPTVIEPAPGEGFKDTFAANPGLALAGYNANYGVALKGSGQIGLAPDDNDFQITGLQITSTTQGAIDFPQRAGNNMIVDHDILEGGTGAPFVSTSGFGNYWYDDLIISHGVAGVYMDYGGYVNYDTIVCPSGTCSGAAVEMTITWTNFQGSVINGDLAFGFTHFVATNFYNNQRPWNTCDWWCVTTQGGNDITDVAGTDGVGFQNCIQWTSCAGISYPSNGFVAYAIPFQTGYTYNSTVQGNISICAYYSSGVVVSSTCQATFSVLPSSVFASWPGNYRILSGSVAYGAGASFPTITYCTGSWPNCTLNTNTPDVVNTARPQGSRFDVGAEELLGGVTIPAGRPFFR